MRIRLSIVFVLILLGVGVNAAAQTTGRVTGRVLDSTGAVLPGVAIDLIVNARELPLPSSSPSIGVPRHSPHVLKSDFGYQPSFFDTRVGDVI
jgi:hypothetical protein